MNKTRSQGPSVLLLTLAALIMLRVAAAEPPTAPTSGAKNAAVVPTEGERAQRLGMLESMQRYCSEREPAAAAKLQKAIDQIVAGLSKSQVADLRQSEDYHLGASSMEQFTAKVDDHNAKRLCKESPADSR